MTYLLRKSSIFFYVITFWKITPEVWLTLDWNDHSTSGNADLKWKFGTDFFAAVYICIYKAQTKSQNPETRATGIHGRQNLLWIFTAGKSKYLQSFPMAFLSSLFPCVVCTLSGVLPSRSLSLALSLFHPHFNVGQSIYIDRYFQYLGP